MLNLKTYPIIRKTDRDLEIPNLLDFLTTYKDHMVSLLDIGGHYTAGYYAPQISKMVDFYEAMDMIDDPNVHPYVTNFIVDDAVTHEYVDYDTIICCSTIEHIGMYPKIYADEERARLQLFEKIMTHAKKYFWLSFPVGRRFTIPGEMTIINEKEMEKYETLMTGKITNIGYFWSDGPQAGKPWIKSDRKKVFNHDYIMPLGNQAICIIEGAV